MQYVLFYWRLFERNSFDNGRIDKWKGKRAERKEDQQEAKKNEGKCCSAAEMSLFCSNTRVLNVSLYM